MGNLFREFLAVPGMNVVLAIYVIGALGLILLGVMLYRFRRNLGEWIPRSIGQLIWYIIVAEIAWFIYVSLGLRPGV
jgi:hypothetical protein